MPIVVDNYKIVTRSGITYRAVNWKKNEFDEYKSQWINGEDKLIMVKDYRETIYIKLRDIESFNITFYKDA